MTLVAPVAIGTTIGAVAGGRALNKLSDKMLRLLFLAIVAYFIVQMLFKGVTLL